MFANFVYVVALVAVAPIVLYRMIRHGRYRRGITQKLLGLSANDAGQLRGKAPGDCVWIHAVSMGERGGDEDRGDEESRRVQRSHVLTPLLRSWRK